MPIWSIPHGFGNDYVPAKYPTNVLSRSSIVVGMLVVLVFILLMMLHKSGLS